MIGSEDGRVALRAVKEALDRTLGRPRQRYEHGRSPGPDMDAALAAAREKLVAALIERGARRPRFLPAAMLALGFDVIIRRAAGLLVGIGDYLSEVE